MICTIHQFYEKKGYPTLDKLMQVLIYKAFLRKVNIIEEATKEDEFRYNMSCLIGTYCLQWRF